MLRLCLVVTFTSARNRSTRPTKKKTAAKISLSLLGEYGLSTPPDGRTNRFNLLQAQDSPIRRRQFASFLAHSLVCRVPCWATQNDDNTAAVPHNIPTTVAPIGVATLGRRIP